MPAIRRPAARAHRHVPALAWIAAAVLASGCVRPAPPPDDRGDGTPPALAAEHRLSTGVRLDPAGRSIPLGNMPLAAAASPDGRYIVVSLSGWREQGLEVVSRATGAVVQRLTQPGAFVGLVWSADGRALYASGGASDRVYVYAWRGEAPNAPARLVDSIALREPGAATAAPGSRYVAGIARSRDGRALYVAENLADSLAVVDVATRRVVQRLGTGAYPYAVVAAPDGRVYVSDWGGATVHVYRADVDGRRLAAERPIDVGRHPSALALSADGTRLFAASASTDRVAAVDTRARRVVRWLTDPPPDALAEGSTPDALALSADGTRLYVAEADANAVAVFDLSPLVSGVAAVRGADTLAGRVPTEWYPTALLAGPAGGDPAWGDSLWVVNGKGRGAGPNPGGPQPGTKLEASDRRAYTLGQLDGTATVLPAARGAALDALSARVGRANGWDAPRAAVRYPPIEHVVYVIKENRTYDQVLGDLELPR